MYIYKKCALTRKKSGGIIIVGVLCPKAQSILIVHGGVRYDGKKSKSPNETVSFGRL